MSVVPNFTPYTEVLVILKRAGEADVDLSEAWSTIEYEDALPQSCKITLTSPFGLFSTRGPIIVKYDKIFVKIVDARGRIIQDVFHVRKIKRPRKPGKSKQLVLFCPHQSEHLWKRTISLTAKRTAGAEALNQLVGILNLPQNKGSDDPDVEIPTPFNITTKVGNNLDPNTSNNYIFEAVKLQTAFDEIKDIEQQPIEGGGSFEAVFIRFKSKYNHDSPSDADLNTVQVQAFPQGFQDNTGVFSNIPNVTLIHQPLESAALPKTNVLTLDTDEDPELATNLHVVADQDSGSYLVNWSQFQGAKDVFNNAKEWNGSSIFYKFGSLVNYLGLVYESITDHTSSGGNPPSTSPTIWINRTFVKPAIWTFGNSYGLNNLVRRLNISWKCIQAHTADSVNEPPNSEFWVRIFFAPAVDYSPLTKANTQLWLNALAGSQFAVDATDVNQGRVCSLDPNAFVGDALHPRTVVRIVTDDPANIPTIHKIAGVDIPDAYRVLAIDPATGAAPTSGIWGPGLTDSNGVLFGGNVIEWVDTDLDGVGEWIVFKSKVLADDQEIFDYNRAEPWIKNPCNPTFTLGIPDRYVDNAGACVFTVGGAPAARSAIWVIGSYAIQQVPLVGQFGVFFENRQMECAHSVKWDLINHHVDMGTTQIIDDDTDGDSAVFIKSAPTLIQGGKDQNPFFLGFMIHALNPLTGQDDAEFPGSGAAGSDIALPTFDFNNMFRDHFGVPSWFGPQSEDFLPIQRFLFWMQFLLTRNPLSEIVNLTEGDFELGIWMVDTRDNVRIIKNINQTRKTDILPQKGDLPGDPYKGIPGASTIFSAANVDPTDAFDPRRFWMGGIYTRDSFDGQGRYLGVKSRFRNATEMQFNMDGYRMGKPIVATNADVLQAKPTRNIGTQLIKKQSIVSYAQAKNLVLGLDKIFNFERKVYTEETGGRCDIAFGDSVYYTDSEEINDTTDSLPNTIKGVNTKNVISLSKGKNGPGGMTNKFDLTTRIWPT